MRQFLLFILALCTYRLSTAQYTYGYLDYNNTRAYVGNGGIFLNNTGSFLGGFEYPLNSDNNLVYSSAFWFGGEDINGQLKLSAQMYQPGVDLFKGAITNDGAATAPSTPFAGELYIVTKGQIDYHIVNYMNVGYVVPNSFIDWPAHGDVGQNLAYYLAPFVDTNNDGVYNPELGDYPEIRGDKAIYLIMNDKANIHSGSGGDPIGIECHFMFYQYASNGYLGNTTFVNMKLINRGTQTLYGFRTGLFVDPDIGYFDDDFVGCDSTRSLMYSYNADNLDDDYGANPPAVGVVNLNDDMSVFGTFAPGGSWDPTFAIDYWKYMNGLWLDASPFTLGGNGYGGTIPTKYLYSGNPNDNTAWSEVSVGNPAGDRRMYMTTAPITLLPFQEICYDFAFVAAGGGNNLENVDALIADADSLIAFFNAQNFACYIPGQLNVEDNYQGDEITVYPNPAQEYFYVSAQGEFDVAIYSLDGKLVFRQNQMTSQEPIPSNFKTGTYLVQVTQNLKTYQLKVIVN